MGEGQGQAWSRAGVWQKPVADAYMCSICPTAGYVIKFPVSPRGGTRRSMDLWHCPEAAEFAADLGLAVAGSHRSLTSGQRPLQPTVWAWVPRRKRLALP